MINEELVSQTESTVENNVQNKPKKSYYETNKDKVMARLNKPHMCTICNKEVPHYYINKHNMTAKHLKLSGDYNKILESIPLEVVKSFIENKTNDS